MSHNDDYYRGMRDGLLLDASVTLGRAAISHAQSRANSRDAATDLLRQARSFQKNAMRRSLVGEQLSDFKLALQRASQGNAIRPDVVSDRAVMELQNAVDDIKRHKRRVGPNGPALYQSRRRGDGGVKTADIS